MAEAVMKTNNITSETNQAVEKLFHQSDSAWVIEQFIPILTALIALFIAYIGFKHAIKRIAKDHQHQFQIRTYEKLLEPISDAVQKTSVFLVMLESFQREISDNYIQQNNGGLAIDTKSNPMDYFDKHQEWTHSLSKVMKDIDSIYIIEPKLKIFVTALSSFKWNIRKNTWTLFNDLKTYLTKEFDDENGIKQKIPPRPISLEEKQRIENLVAEMREDMLEGLNYIDDLKIELQNLLLGQVYNNRTLPHKVPVNPKLLVISIENYDFLDKHFRENHPMGQEEERRKKEIREQVKNAA